MVSSYEYALLSLHVYQDANDMPQLPGGWTVYRVFEEGIFDNGYSGMAYRTTTTGELVFAHRGTDSLADLFLALFVCVARRFAFVLCKNEQLKLEEKK